MIRVELRHTDTELIEHLALCIAERPQSTRLLFGLFDIHCVSGDTFFAQRKIADPHRPTLPVDSSRHHALDRQVLLRRLCCHFRSSHALHRFDQFDLPCYHRFCTFPAHSTHISAIDQFESRIRSTKPHRQRRSFNQTDQSGKITARTRCIGTQSGEFVFAFGKVEDPQQRGASGKHLRVSKCSANRQTALRSRYGQRHAERRSGFLRAADMLGQRDNLILRQALALPTHQFAEEPGQFIEPEPAREPFATLDPAIGANHQRDRRCFVDHAGHATRRLAGCFRPAGTRAGSQHQPRRSSRPSGQQQADQHQYDRREFHNSQLCATRARCNSLMVRPRQSEDCRGQSAISNDSVPA